MRGLQVSLLQYQGGTDKLELVSCFFQGLGVGMDVNVYLQK